MNNMRPKWFAEAMMDGVKPDGMMDMDEQIDDDGEMMMGHAPMEMMGHHHHHQHMMLAHAYVPWQCYREAFCPPEALMKGTLFPELFGVYPIPK